MSLVDRLRIFVLVPLCDYVHYCHVNKGITLATTSHVRLKISCPLEKKRAIFSQYISQCRSVWKRCILKSWPALNFYNKETK